MASTILGDGNCGKIFLVLRKDGESRIQSPEKMSHRRK